MEYPTWGTTHFAGTVVFSFAIICFVIAAHLTWGLALLNALFMRRARIKGDACLSRVLHERAGWIVIAPLAVTLASAVIAIAYAGAAYPVATSAIVHALLIPLTGAVTLVIAQACAAGISGISGHVLSDRQRETLAWAHAAGAFGWVVLTSLVTSFMTTPGRWLVSHSAWDAVVNPTFAPSLSIGAAWGIAMGSATLMLITHLSRNIAAETSTALERLFIRPWWALAAAVPFVPIYFMATAETYTSAAWSSSSTVACALGGIAAALAAFIVLGATALRRIHMGAGGSIAVLLIMSIAIGEGVIAQAGMRSPFAIAGYLYTNGIATSDMPRLNREGVLAHAIWVVPPGIDLTLVPPAKRGEWVYRALSYARYPWLKPEHLYRRLDGLDDAAARLIIMNIDMLDVRTPPFAGTPDEANDLVAFIRSSASKEHRE